QPRTTVDVDITLLTGFGGEERYIEVLLHRFQPRIPDAMQFALARRVLLLKSHAGVGIDVALGGLPFEERVVTRSSLFLYPPRFELRTCSAEDLIVLKAFAARGQDWVDIEGIITRQRGALDWVQILAELGPLAELKEKPEILQELDRRRRAFEM